MGIRASPGADAPAAEQRHHRAARGGRPARRRARGAARRGRRGPAAGGRQRARRAVVRPDARPDQRAAAEGCSSAGSSHGVPFAVGIRRADDAARARRPTGSAAPACWCGGPTPKRSGCWTSGIFMYTEDVDFCAAIRARGRRILFTPDVEVVHLRGRSSGTARRLPPARRTGAASWPSTRNTIPRWAPFLRWYLRLQGRL